MKTPNFAPTRILPALVMACALAAVYAGPAAAQTATKLKCKGCVGSKQLKNGGIKSKDIGAGQVLNSDLGANAVTGAKIADGAVGNADLADNAVTSGKIADGAVGSADLAADAVGSAEVADGSLAGADLADGAIGAAKLGLANTTYLEDTGSDTGNCDDLRGALAGLAGPAAVVLGPGTYDCGTNPVNLPAQVSLIGSGRNLTTITGSVDAVDGLVRLQGDGITLRGLTVVNDDSGGAGTNFIAVVVGAGSVDTRNWRIGDVTAEAMNGTSFSIGLFARTIDCDRGEMTDVTATASGSPGANRGVQLGCTAGSATASNLTAKASGAAAEGLLTSSESSLTARNSSFTGATFSARRFSGTLKVISSELDGPVSGTVICVGDYDGAGAALADGTFGSGGCV